MKKILDLSCYNKVTDYAKASKYIDGVILKIVRKDLAKDSLFETHYNGFKGANKPIIGVYNYSYATSISKAEKDAQSVVGALNGRKLKVWLDVEDNCQKNLGQKLIDIILTYKNVITKNGLEFGVYTGQSFYNSYLKPYYNQIKDIDMWIARYPSTKNINVSYVENVKYQPKIANLEGWQYSSKCVVEGITGVVDISEWYEPIQKIEVSPLVNTLGYKEPTRIIKKTIPLMSGDDVKWVQHNLIRLGFLAPLNSKGKTNIDGKFGNDCYNAVIKCQKANSKNPKDHDGIVGAQTRIWLKK